MDSLVWQKLVYGFIVHMLGEFCDKLTCTVVIPRPPNADPMIGTIQCVLNCSAHPYQRNPTTTIGIATIVAGSRNSGSVVPLFLRARACMILSFVLPNMTEASTKPSASPKYVLLDCPDVMPYWSWNTLLISTRKTFRKPMTKKIRTQQRATTGDRVMSLRGRLSAVCSSDIRVPCFLCLLSPWLGSPYIARFSVGACVSLKMRKVHISVAAVCCC